MGRRLWPASGAVRGVWIAAAAIVLVAAVMLIVRPRPLPTLQSMGIEAQAARLLPVVQGPQWQPPAAGADGFAKVTENARFTLLLDPVTSQIAVLDKGSGYLWRSNPPSDRLAKETVKGALLENLQSPFILETTSGTETRRSTTNARDPKMSAAYTPIGQNGIQVTYTHSALKLSFVIQYTLTDRGLEAAIPTEGIREEGDANLFAINLLPFFGAVSGQEEEGYLFVPDGPGGLIYYDRKRPAAGSVYDFPIYGDDPALMKDRETAAQREPIAYPVYGLKRGDHAFAAVVKEGQFTASIKAALPGNVSTYHTVSANFRYREEYGRKVSGVTGEVVSAIRKERVREDRRVEYRLLSGGEANYAGMANAYRDYLAENGRLGPKLQATDHIPMRLTLIGGGTKPKFGGSRFEAATTFAEAEQIVGDLTRSGVSGLRVTYLGWQSSGHAETDERFPIAPAIGGTEGARQFIRSMHDRGIEVQFGDFMGWKYPKYSSFYVKSDGIRGIDSTVLQGRPAGVTDTKAAKDGVGRFIVNPVKAVRAQKDVVDKLKRIGADGIHYVDGPGNLAFSDYNPSSPLSRQDTAFYYNSLLDYTRRELGKAGVVRGNDYSLSYADWIEKLPLAPSYDVMIDETVPFYPMVVHGAVEYTAAPGNLRNVYDDEMLKAIEYGAVPYFELTYAPSRMLKETDYDYVYSSEFAVWRDRIAEEYRKFDRLASVYDKRMTGHEKVAEGVYRTAYEDGTTVTVDYNAKRFDVAKGGAK